MCVGTTAAIAIAATAASTAGTVYAAKKGSDAAHEAAQTQQDAAQRALTGQQQQYAQQRQDFAPYQQAGQASLGRLNSLATAPRPVFNASQPGGGFQAPPPQQMPQMPQIQPGMMGQQGQMAQPSGMPPQAKMALLQAPDGTTKQIPEEQAAHFIQQGARRIG